MGLRMKFNLVLSLATLVGLIATGILAMNSCRKKRAGSAELRV